MKLTEVESLSDGQERNKEMFLQRRACGRNRLADDNKPEFSSMGDFIL